MDKDKKSLIARTPDVLRKLNPESLLLIERGLLGDIPKKLQPNFVPVRGLSTDLQVAKPSGFLSSCLPVIPDSPGSDKFSSDDETTSPLKKSFSFRDKISRISFLRKDKQKHEKAKCKTIVEDDKALDSTDSSKLGRSDTKSEHDYKSDKRFWFFRQKEAAVKRQKLHTPIYQRSKSFEFLPRAVAEENERKPQNPLSRQNSFAFGSTDTVGEAWTSSESLQYISDVGHNNDDGVFLKSVKTIQTGESSNNDSSMSTVTSASSGIPTNILKSESVQDLLDKFSKAVELFSENYLSDCEPYTRTSKEVPLKEKRKSASFSTLPSPKVVQVTAVKPSDEFRTELSRLLNVKVQKPLPKSPRRGSVTDWFVLEEEMGDSLPSERVSLATMDANKFRRAQKKPMNRVRRISSTKYWITPEECAVYSREQRPPLVIPRITQYRAPRKPHNSNIYVEDSALDQGPRHIKQYDRLHDQSPKSERGRVDIERSFSKANSDSPPFVRINKRLGASTENLLVVNGRRPNNLHLPASSSGDSLDVEVRDKEPSLRKRQSRSMMAPNPRVRSPVPAPRQMLAKPEITVDYEGPVKRTRYLESGKKCKKNWTDCYMVLTSTALVFYRDQKTYYASKLPKLPGTPPSPGAARAELVLPLKNAHVVQCIATYTRRFSRSVMLTVGYDQYLIQDDTEEGCRRWLKSIQNIIYSLGPSEDFRSPQYQSSNTDLESLGRTPPVSRHANRNKTKAGGSSNEDLSDSTEVSIQKSHVRSRLRKFFAKRPAMDVLIKKGIYKDEPVFGRNLEEVCPANSPRVPDFVIACVKEIESNEENMCTDGLYRASGNLSQVQKIRLEIDQNNLSVIESSADIHVLTGSLKLFFRELKEPLIPCSMFDRVLAACSLKSREVRIKEFRDIVQALPQCNRDTLKYLLQHLLRVTQYSDHNRMHTANLAIVFGPTLLWAPAEQAHNIAIDCIQQNNVVEILLNDYKDIFVDDPTKGKKKA